MQTLHITLVYNLFILVYIFFRYNKNRYSWIVNVLTPKRLIFNFFFFYFKDVRDTKIIKLKKKIQSEQILSFSF